MMAFKWPLINMPISAHKKVTWWMKREKKLPLKNVSKKISEKEKEKKYRYLLELIPRPFACGEKYQVRNDVANIHFDFHICSYRLQVGALIKIIIIIIIIIIIMITIIIRIY